MAKLRCPESHLNWQKSIQFPYDKSSRTAYTAGQHVTLKADQASGCTNYAATAMAYRFDHPCGMQSKTNFAQTQWQEYHALRAENWVLVVAFGMRTFVTLTHTQKLV